MNNNGNSNWHNIGINNMTLNYVQHGIISAVFRVEVSVASRKSFSLAHIWSNQILSSYNRNVIGYISCCVPFHLLPKPERRTIGTWILDFQHWFRSTIEQFIDIGDLHSSGMFRNAAQKCSEHFNFSFSSCVEMIFFHGTKSSNVVFISEIHNLK